MFNKFINRLRILKNLDTIVDLTMNSSKAQASLIAASYNHERRIEELEKKLKELETVD